MKKVFFLFSLIFTFHILSAQETSKKINVNGHIQAMHMLWANEAFENWQTMNSLSNRMDFRWYPSNNIRTHIGIRNIFNYGQIVSDFYPAMAYMAVIDQGKLDLTAMISKNKSHFLYTKLDRMNFEFTSGNLTFTVGRQRINWGINIVWNSNDIFNAYNYFDFDYIEKPGCDAIHVQYYTGMTSSIQFAYKLDHDNRSTYALMYQFNKLEYDFQFLTGILNDDDFILGLGWAGQIEGAGFVGEITYFKNIDNAKEKKEILVGSISVNYTFSNNLMIQGAFLYNSNGTNRKAGSENIFILGREISAKEFTRAKYSIFGQLSYPLTPLINTDLSGIFNPSDNSGYVGPSITYSLTKNIDLTINSQIFIGSNGSEFGNYGSMFFTRLKWSF
jgi:hypothetical protein